jgi:hypothetical protein
LLLLFLTLRLGFDAFYSVNHFSGGDITFAFGTESPGNGTCSAQKAHDILTASWLNATFNTFVCGLVIMVLNYTQTSSSESIKSKEAANFNLLQLRKLPVRVFEHDSAYTIAKLILDQAYRSRKATLDRPIMGALCWYLCSACLRACKNGPKAPRFLSGSLAAKREAETILQEIVPELDLMQLDVKYLQQSGGSEALHGVDTSTLQLNSSEFLDTVQGFEGLRLLNKVRVNLGTEEGEGQYISGIEYV